MEWRRVKIIMILLFLTLNIYLAVNLVLLAASAGSDREMTGDAAKALAAGGVKINCEIPDYTVDMGYPEYSEPVYDASVIETYVKGQSSESSMQISEDGTVTIYNIPDADIGSVSDMDELAERIKSILEAMGIQAGNFVPDSRTVYDGQRSSVTLVEKAGRLVYSYGNTAELVISPTGIEYMRLSIFKQGHIYDYSPVLPAYRILLKNCLRPGLVIDKVDLGYIGYKLTPDSTGSTYIAAWRVVDGNGSARYYRASTGDEIHIY